MTPQYDHLGQRIEQTVSAGTGTSSLSVVTKSVYDSQGRVTAEINPMGLTRQFGYDQQGRLTSVTLPEVPNPNCGALAYRCSPSDFVDPPAANPLYEYGYDAQGNQTLIRDPLGRETRFTFDAQGHQLSRTLPLGFGADGQLGTTDDPTNVASGSQLAFPTNESERAPFTEYMKHNELGQQVAHLSFEGKVTQFIYDNSIPGGSGRVMEQRYFDDLSDYSGGSGTATEKIEFRYDAFGRTVEKRWIRSATVTDVWTTQFDAFGRVTKETSPQGTVNYSYDHLGRQTRTYTTVPDGQGGMNITNDTEFEYDALGRLAKVSVVERNDAAVSPTEDTTYRYDLAGNMDYQTTPDGVVGDQVYDALFRLGKLTNYRPDPSTPGTFTDNPKLAEFDYSVRADGKRTNATETFWLDADNDPQTDPTPHVNTIAWSYDGAGRLTDEVFDHYDNSLDFAEHYDFDLTGNRLRKKLDTGAFVGGAPASPAIIDEAIHYLYDANDRLLEEQLDADNDGNVDETTEYAWNATQQSSKSVTATGNATPTCTQTFTYNLQGRMSGIELSGFNVAGQLTRKQTLTYSYGPDGIRVATVDAIDSDGDGDIDSRTKTEFLIDAHDATGYQQIIQEVTTNADTGANINRVIYNIGLDQISQTTFTPGGPSAGETRYFHIDGHGSTRVLTDTVGAIATFAGALQLFHFDAYGNPLGFPGQAATTFLYNNEQRDVAGLYNFRARPYDPLTARFLSLDSFVGNRQDPLSFHKYLFVHADPIGGIDPSGNENLAVSMAKINITMNLISAAGNVSIAALQYARGDRHGAMLSLVAAEWNLFFALFGVLFPPAAGPGGALGLAGGGTISMAGTLELMVNSTGILVGTTAWINALVNIVMSSRVGVPNSPPDPSWRHEIKVGPGDWYSGIVEHMDESAAAFQESMSGKPNGWGYWLDGKKFDCYDDVIGVLADAKTNNKGGYTKLLTDPKLRDIFRPAFIEDLIKQRDIALRYGKQFVVKAQGSDLARLIREILQEEGVRGIPVEAH